MPNSTSQRATVAETASRLRLAIARLARLLRQLDSGEISQPLLSAMYALEVRGAMTFGELAAFEQVAPPTITKIVERLEALGLVTRTQDVGDRRVHRVAITPAGKLQLETNRTLRTAWLAERLAALAPDELGDIESLLPLLEQLAAPPQRPEDDRR